MDSTDESASPSKKRRISVACSQEQSSKQQFQNAVLVFDQNSNEVDAAAIFVESNLKFKTKITDLNVECLQHILGQLDFRDFLNAANSTKKLREAAVKIYTAQYGDKFVKYNDNAMKTTGLETDVTDTTIEINESRTCLKMMRGFGAVITKLTLNFNGIGLRRSRAITKALNDYCKQSLIKLEWHNCPENAIMDASQKFINLKSLQIVSGYVGVEMGKIGHYFPKLKRLELSDVEVSDRKCIEHTFHSIVYLKLKIESQKKMDFLKSNVKAALNLNPQLKSFSLTYGCDVKLLNYINDKLPLLESLEIQNPRKKFFDTDEDKIVFNRVKCFSLDINSSTDSFTNIPFEFRRLRSFTLNACARHRDEWIDFAVQNRNLVELKLRHFHWFYVMQQEQLLKIAQLQKLSTFFLDWRVASTDAVTHFIGNCDSLKTFKLMLPKRQERADIMAEIGNNWNSNIDEHFLTLERNDELIVE